MTSLAALQPGDPQRLAEALITLVHAEKPPRRLPLGANTVSRIQQKHQEVEFVVNQSGTATATNTDGGPTPPGTASLSPSTDALARR